MTDPATPTEPEGLAARVAALRPKGALGISRKDMSVLMRAGDGISLMHQAPKTSSDSIGGLQYMLRRVPTTRRQPVPRIGVGDAMPDFDLPGSNGSSVSLADLVGVKPFAMRLTRAYGTGVF